MSVIYQPLLGQSSIDATHVAVDELEVTEKMSADGDVRLNDFTGKVGKLDTVELSTGFRLEPDAAVGRLLTSDLDGRGSWKTFDTALDGEVTGDFKNTVMKNNSVIGKILTGLDAVVASGVVLATDTILAAMRKIKDTLGLHRTDINSNTSRLDAFATQINTDKIESNGNTLTLASAAGTETVNMGAGAGVQVVNVGTGPGQTTINIGSSGDTVAINGTLTTVNTADLHVRDKLMRLNRDGLLGSGFGSGIEVEEAGVPAAYVKLNGDRTAWLAKAPNASEVTLTPVTAVTMGGDVTGSSSSSTVEKIRGRTITTATPITNETLVWSGSQWNYTNLPTAVTMGGDVTGSSSSSTVEKIRGRTITTATPVTNQTLVWSGSQWNYTNLPTSVTMGGDVTGNSSSTTVSAVGGKTASAVATAVTAVEGAAAGSFFNTIMKRDANGYTYVHGMHFASSFQYKKFALYDNNSGNNVQWGGMTNDTSSNVIYESQGKHIFNRSGVMVCEMGGNGVNTPYTVTANHLVSNTLSVANVDLTPSTYYHYTFFTGPRTTIAVTILIIKIGKVVHLQIPPVGLGNTTTTRSFFSASSYLPTACSSFNAPIQMATTVHKGNVPNVPAFIYIVLDGRLEIIMANQPSWNVNELSGWDQQLTGTYLLH